MAGAAVSDCRTTASVSAERFRGPGSTTRPSSNDHDRLGSTAARTPSIVAPSEAVAWHAAARRRHIILSLADRPWDGQQVLRIFSGPDRPRLRLKTKPVHRPEVNGGDHACIHDALLAIWQKLEDVEIQSRVPELEPPKLEVLPSPQQRVIEVEEEPTEEVSGIIMGFEEQKARENETEDVDA